MRHEARKTALTAVQFGGGSADTRIRPSKTLYLQTKIPKMVRIDPPGVDDDLQEVRVNEKLNRGP